MRAIPSRASSGHRFSRGLAGAVSAALVAGAAGLGAAAPARAAVEYINPFDVNQGFTVVGTGDVVLGNGELEGSAAAFGTISTPKDNYALIHHTAGMADYELPVIDGDPVRVLANQFTGTGNFDQSNRDDSGTASQAATTAISKFADTSNLTAAPRGDNFTRLTNTDGGVFDLKALPFDAATWQDEVTTQQPVAGYFGDVEAQVGRTNQCLAAMYQAPDLANELTVTGDQNQATLSGFGTTMPNWVNYEDIAGKNLNLDPSDWQPTADAPLIIRVNDPSDTVGTVNVNGWSFTADQQQAYARYILFDASADTAGTITVDAVEGGAVWAPGANVVLTNSRTINGQIFGEDVTTGGPDGTGGGELHHHAFLGRIPCETAGPTATFQIHKEVTGDAADRVPDDTEFPVDWEVTTGPNAGRAGTLTVSVDGAVVDGPDLQPGDEVTFTEGAMPDVDGVVWGDPMVSPNPLTLDDSGTVVDVTVTNTANPEPTGGFAVTKAIDGSAAGLVDPTTEFTVHWQVTDGPDTGESGDLVVPADGSIVDGPQNLVDGDVVTFSEPDAPTVDGATFEGVSIDPESITIDTSAAETPVVTVTNTYDLAPATFRIHKVVTGDAAGQVPDDTEFSVGWEVVDGQDAGQTGTLTVLADGTVVEGPTLSHGDVVEFSELDPPEIDGVVWGDPMIDPSQITLDATTDTVDVTVTNTAGPAPAGGFGVLKAIDGTGEDLVPADTEFTVDWEVTEGPDTGRTGTLTVPADGTLAHGPQDLANGDVVIFSEPEAPQLPGTTFEGVSIAPESITIDSSAPEAPVVTVTNTYDLAPASFSAHKIVTGAAADMVPGDAVVELDWQVTAGENVGRVGTLELPADGTVVDGPELAHGDVVEFTEATPPAVDGVVWGAPTISPESIALDADADRVDVEVTNVANPLPTGGFAVTKVLGGTGADLVPAGTEFTVRWEVTEGPGAGRSGILTVPADGSLVDGPQDLADGDVVTFSEPQVPQVPGTTFERVSIDPGSITIDASAAGKPVVTVTNTYDRAPATFRMYKVITGEAVGLVPDDTEFTVGWEVTAGPDAGRSGTLTLSADGALVDGPVLSHGDIVEFSEPDLPEIDGVRWGGVSIDPETLLLDATAGTVSVQVTNTAQSVPTPPGPNPPVPDPPVPNPPVPNVPGFLPQTGPDSILTLLAVAGLLALSGGLLHRFGTRQEG